jgi:hypothetical protein
MFEKIKVKVYKPISKRFKYSTLPKVYCVDEPNKKSKGL